MRYRTLWLFVALGFALILARPNDAPEEDDDLDSIRAALAQAGVIVDGETELSNDQVESDINIVNAAQTLGNLWGSILDAGLTGLNFPITNKAGVMWQTKAAFLQALLDKGALRALRFPLNDANGLILQNKQAFIEALLNINFTKTLQFPLADASGKIVFADASALLAALFDVKALAGLEFPLTNTAGKVYGNIKDVLKVLTAVQRIDQALGGALGFGLGGSSSVAIDVKSLDSNYFNNNDDNLDELIDLLIKGGAILHDEDNVPNLDISGIPYRGPIENDTVAEVQANIGFLLLSEAPTLSFPLPDINGKNLRNKLDLFIDMATDEALNALNFPLTDSKFFKIKTGADYMRIKFDHCYRYFKFPMTNNDGQIFKDKLDMLSAQVKGSDIAELSFPLTDGKRGRINDINFFIKALMDNTLNYPLTDQRGQVVKDIVQVILTIFNNDVLATLKLPITDANGHVFKNTVELGLPMSNSAIDAFNFPLTNVRGKVFKDVNDIIKTLIDAVVAPAEIAEKAGELLGEVIEIPDISGIPDRGPIANDSIADVEANIGFLLLSQAPTLGFPVPETSGNNLRNKVDLFIAMARDVALEALKFPLVDRKFKTIKSRPDFMRIIFDNCYRYLKFPLINKDRKVFKDKVDLVDGQVKGSDIAKLKFPLTDSKRGRINDINFFIKGLLDDTLNYPLTDQRGQVIKDIVQVIRTIFSDEALTTLKVPMTEANGYVLKTTVDLFLPMPNSALDAFDFPLTNAEGSVLKDVNDILKTLVNVVVTPEEIAENAAELLDDLPEIPDITGIPDRGPIANDSIADVEANIGFLLLSQAPTLGFPVPDTSGNNLKNKVDLFIAMARDVALEALKFPLIDRKLKTIKSRPDFMRIIFDNCYHYLKFPLINNDRKVFKDKVDLVDGQVKGSDIAKLKFPLTDSKRGRVNDINFFIKGLLDDTLNYPLTDQRGQVIKDIVQVIRTIFSDEALTTLKVPITEANGYVLKTTVDLFLPMPNSALDAFDFPLTNAEGSVLKDVNDILKTLVNVVVTPAEIAENAAELLDDLPEIPDITGIPDRGPIANDSIADVEANIGFLLLSQAPTLGFPVPDTSGNNLRNKVDLFIAMARDVALEALKFPLIDRKLKTIKSRPDFMRIVFDNCYHYLKFPLINNDRKVFKDKVDLVDGQVKGSDIAKLKFPLTDSKRGRVNDINFFIKGLLDDTLNYPLTDQRGQVIKDIVQVIRTIFSDEALTTLKVPMTEANGYVIKTTVDLFLPMPNSALDAFDFPLTNAEGSVLKDVNDILKTLVNVVVTPEEIAENAAELLDDLPEIPDITGIPDRGPIANETVADVEANIGFLLLSQAPTLGFPVPDTSGINLRNKVDLFIAMARDFALEALKFPLVDRKFKTIKSRPDFMRIIFDNCYHYLKFPLINRDRKVFKDKVDLVDGQVKGSDIAKLKFPLTDSKRGRVSDISFFIKGLLDNTLNYPLIDQRGQVIKDIVQVIRTIFSDEALTTLRVPITDANGHVLKTTVDLFLPMPNSALDAFDFPLTNAEGSVLEDVNDILKTLVNVVVTPEEIAENAAELLDFPEFADDSGIPDRGPIANDSVAEVQDNIGFLLLSQAPTLEFPVPDTSGNNLKNKVDLFMAMSRDVALEALKFPLIDGKFKRINSRPDFMRILFDNCYRYLKFPLRNNDGKVFKNKVDLIDGQVKGSDIAKLKFPLTDSKRARVNDINFFIKGLIDDTLNYPLTDQRGQVVKDLVQVIRAIFNDEALTTLKLPITEETGHILKTTVDLFLPMPNSGLDALDFPMTNAQGKVLKDVNDIIKTVVNVVVFPSEIAESAAELLQEPSSSPSNTVEEIEFNIGDLLLTNNPVFDFPLPDRNGMTLQDKVALFVAMAQDNALATLNFPLIDGNRFSIQNGAEYFRIVFKNHYNTLLFPLTNTKGEVFKNRLDLVGAQVKGSPLAKLKFPLTDSKGGRVRDLEAFIQGLVNDSLNFPLTDQNGKNIKDLVQVVRIIYSGKVLSTLKLPLTDRNGQVYKMPVDLLLPMINSGLAALKFPMTNSRGKVFRNVNDVFKLLVNAVITPQEITENIKQVLNRTKTEGLLEAAKQALLDVQNSLGALILSNVSLITFPVTDKEGNILNDKIELLLDLIVKKTLESLNFPLIDNEGLRIRTEDDLLKKIFDNVFSNLKFPLITKTGLKINNKAELLDAFFNGSPLKQLKFPLNGAQGQKLNNKSAFLQTFINDGLAFPLSDSSPGVLKVLKGLPDLWNLIFGSQALGSLDYPITQTNGPVIRNKVQLFLAMTNSGLDNLNYPISSNLDQSYPDKNAGINVLLRVVLSPSELARMAGDVLKKSKDLVWNILGNKPKDVPNFNKTIEGIEDNIGDLLLTNEPVLNFPLTSTSGRSLRDKIDLFMNMIEDNALDALRFPLTDADGSPIKDQSAILRIVFDNCYNDLVFPLTTKIGDNWTNKTELCRCQIDRSVLKSLQYPLRDVNGDLVEDKNSFLSGLINDTLNFPLTDNADVVLKDLVQVLRLIFDGDTLGSLSYPITQGNGQLLKTKVDLIVSNANSGTAALRFPMINSQGREFEDINDMMKALIDVVVPPEELVLKIIKDSDILLEDDQFLPITKKLAQLCTFSECGTTVFAQKFKRAQLLNGILNLLSDIVDLSNCNNFANLKLELQKYNQQDSSFT